MSKPTHIQERPQHRHEELIRRDAAAHDKRLDRHAPRDRPVVRLGVPLAQRFQCDDGARRKVLEADAHCFAGHCDALIIRYRLAGGSFASEDLADGRRDDCEAERQLSRLGVGRGDGPAVRRFFLGNGDFVAAGPGRGVVGVVGGSVGEGVLFKQFAVHGGF